LDKQELKRKSTVPPAVPAAFIPSQSYLKILGVKPPSPKKIYFPRSNKCKHKAGPTSSYNSGFKMARPAARKEGARMPNHQHPKCIWQNHPHVYVKGMVLVLTLATLSCGKKKEFDHGESLGPAIMEGTGTGSSRMTAQPVVTSSPTTTTTSTVEEEWVTVTRYRLKPAPTYNIVPVTLIVEANDDAASWSAATLPFAVAAGKIFPYGVETVAGTPARDGAWPIAFNFEYPANNFQFKSAHVLIETKRDSSDTEGIFVDGVFSGRPPSGMVNSTSAAITDHVYEPLGTNTLGTNTNRTYIEWSLAHYKRDAANFFDLNLTNLLAGTSHQPYDKVKDGRLQVVLGDDSPALKAYLVINGLTISSSELHCIDSSPYSLKNRLVHNDGNSIGVSAFSGTIKPLYQAWSDPLGQTATEFYFDTSLPDTPLDKISLTSASLSFTFIKQAAGACPMIVINGIGVSSSACNRSTANGTVVESWDEDAGASAAWSSFIAAIPNTVAGAPLSLDLIGLFGEEKVRTLLKQGKFNIALAGGVAAKSANGATLEPATSRTFGHYVDGPELAFEGSYTIESCAIVDDPNSPMTEAGFIEPAPAAPEYESYEERVLASTIKTTEVNSSESSVVNDGVSPAIASVQVQDITSTGATIYWTTDEPATSQVRWGIISPDSANDEDSNLVTFHKVTLTGLSPYKYYKFQVYSKDKYGNTSSSNIAVFTTLR
jgi:hypothetical protein